MKFSKQSICFIKITKIRIRRALKEILLAYFARENVFGVVV